MDDHFLMVSWKKNCGLNLGRDLDFMGDGTAFDFGFDQLDEFSTQFQFDSFVIRFDQKIIR